jgi:type VI secretion system protein ImpM
VLMPSVDKVGRYFPLTLVARLPDPPHSAAEFEALLSWLQRLEDLAVDAMHDDWSVEALEEALVALPSPIPEPEPSIAQRSLAEAIAGGGDFVDISGLRRRADLAGLLWEALAEGIPSLPAAEGLSFWLADNPSAPQLLVSRGLPTAERFIRMLGSGGMVSGDTTIT